MTLTKENARRILGNQDIGLFCNDEVIEKLEQDFRTQSPGKGSNGVFYLLVDIYNTGLIRGKQMERARRRTVGR